MAESAIATAREDGIAPATLHAEVIAPALARIRELRRGGEIDSDGERLAQGMTRRVLATLARVMVDPATPARERVLVASIEGDEHTLELQMIHDQIAAAGFETSFEDDLPLERVSAAVTSASAALVVLGSVPESHAGPVAEAVREARASEPKLAVVFSGPATGGALPASTDDARVLERIDEAVSVAQDAIAARE
jgi:methanogenic corrinoid protein MtbC1